ncbi:hypothetical protein F5148DRAFT_182082 [Russula earlei]|uniref:Uncharacterized protein n=1 Tax=Russula earlei TaxID=71964 RepID=A0ACC0UJL9_9AGAM|nr:hypothetical protein F5148DRAFT_182082 [Russula earlei]
MFDMRQTDKFTPATSPQPNCGQFTSSEARRPNASTAWQRTHMSGIKDAHMRFAEATMACLPIARAPPLWSHLRRATRTTVWRRPPGLKLNPPRDCRYEGGGGGGSPEGDASSSPPGPVSMFSQLAGQWSVGGLPTTLPRTKIVCVLGRRRELVRTVPPRTPRERRGAAPVWRLAGRGGGAPAASERIGERKAVRLFSHVPLASTRTARRSTRCEREEWWWSPLASSGRRGGVA